MKPPEKYEIENYVRMVADVGIARARLSSATDPADYVWSLLGVHLKVGPGGVIQQAGPERGPHVARITRRHIKRVLAALGME